MKYRNTFGKDIVVDITCFRKYGHNELDEPSFTNPLMYKEISERQSVPDLYKEKLTGPENCIVDKEIIEHDVAEFRANLDDALDQVNKKKYVLYPRNTYLSKQWAHMSLPSETSTSNWDTGCEKNFLNYVAKQSVTYPKDFVSLSFYLFAY